MNGKIVKNQVPLGVMEYKGKSIEYGVHNNKLYVLGSSFSRGCPKIERKLKNIYSTSDLKDLAQRIIIENLDFLIGNNKELTVQSNH
jgi:uncharacterized secreted protein with C-terminal beta-propeller domain